MAMTGTGGPANCGPSPYNYPFNNTTHLTQPQYLCTRMNSTPYSINSMMQSVNGVQPPAGLGFLNQSPMQLHMAPPQMPSAYYGPPQQVNMNQNQLAMSGFANPHPHPLVLQSPQGHLATTYNNGYNPFALQTSSPQQQHSWNGGMHFQRVMYPGMTTANPPYSGHHFQMQNNMTGVPNTCPAGMVPIRCQPVPVSEQVPVSPYNNNNQASQNGQVPPERFSAPEFDPNCHSNSQDQYEDLQRSSAGFIGGEPDGSDTIHELPNAELEMGQPVNKSNSDCSIEMIRTSSPEDLPEHPVSSLASSWSQPSSDLVKSLTSILKTDVKNKRHHNLKSISFYTTGEEGRVSQVSASSSEVRKLSFNPVTTTAQATQTVCPDPRTTMAAKPRRKHSPPKPQGGSCCHSGCSSGGPSKPTLPFGPFKADPLCFPPCKPSINEPIPACPCECIPPSLSTVTLTPEDLERLEKARKELLLQQEFQTQRNALRIQQELQNQRHALMLQKELENQRRLFVLQQELQARRQSMTMQREIIDSQRKLRGLQCIPPRRRTCRRKRCSRRKLCSSECDDRNPSNCEENLNNILHTVSIQANECKSISLQANPNLGYEEDGCGGFCYSKPISSPTATADQIRFGPGPDTGRLKPGSKINPTPPIQIRGTQIKSVAPESRDNLLPQPARATKVLGPENQSLFNGNGTVRNRFEAHNTSAAQREANFSNLPLRPRKEQERSAGKPLFLNSIKETAEEPQEPQRPTHERRNEQKNNYLNSYHQTGRGYAEQPPNATQENSNERTNNYSERYQMDRGGFIDSKNTTQENCFGFEQSNYSNTYPTQGGYGGFQSVTQENVSGIQNNYPNGYPIEGAYADPQSVAQENSNLQQSNYSNPYQTEGDDQACSQIEPRAFDHVENKGPLSSDVTNGPPRKRILQTTVTQSVAITSKSSHTKLRGATRN